MKFCVLLLKLLIENERKMENHFYVYNFLFSILSTLYRLLYLQWCNSKHSAWRPTLLFLQYCEVPLHPGKLHRRCEPLAIQWFIRSNCKLFAGWCKLRLSVKTLSAQAVVHINNGLAKVKGIQSIFSRI